MDECITGVDFADIVEGDNRKDAIITDGEFHWDTDAGEVACGIGHLVLVRDCGGAWSVYSN